MSDRAFFDAERDRRISNLVREGVITEIQGATARVKLTEDLVTDFLPVRQVHAGRVRSWSPMKIGEQVSVLSTSGETGVGTILRGLSCAAFAPPSTSADLVVFAEGDDGYLDTYDLAQHVRTVTVPAGGQLVVNVGAHVQLQATDSQLTFKVDDNTEVVITAGLVTVKGAAVALGPDGNRKPVARVGDQVQVGANFGTITQGSSAVTAG